MKRGAAVRLELASLYFSRGQFNTALDEVKLAIQADPGNGQAYNLSGLIYAALGNMAQADASFQRALQINPRDARHDEQLRLGALPEPALQGSGKPSSRMRWGNPTTAARHARCA